MAVEKNPFDKKEETTNVISINAPKQDEGVSFEVDTDGGVTVNFGEENIEEEVTAKEYYTNLATDMDEEVLKDVADMQLNLESRAAREFLANKINSALLAEIRKRKPETFVTDVMYDASIDAYHKND